MKKIGIFLGVEYFRHSPEELSREGLIRLTAVLVDCMSRLDDIEPVILCSKISKNVIEKALSDTNQKNKLTFLTTTTTPPLFWKLEHKTKPLNKKSWIRSSFLKLTDVFNTIKKKLIKKLIVRSLSSFKHLYLSSASIVLILIAVVDLIFHYPKVFLLIISILLIIGGIYIISRKLIKRIPRNISVRIMSKFIGDKSLMNQLYNYIKSFHLNELIEIINKSDIDFVFIPTAFYPEVAKIVKPKVVTLPDLVVRDYPHEFAKMPNSNWKFTIDRMLNLIKNNQYFITYSRYVAEHTLYPLASHGASVRVIPHGNLSISKEVVKCNDASTFAYAGAVLQDYAKKSYSIYVRNINFTNIKYIVYTSQNRPHKNITNLLKAYNILLREKFCNIKLIITGMFHHTPSVNEYIVNNNLQYDVLSFPNLSNKELAALDRLALLSVNPTLFEGGFPFTFNEAFSVGTPSIMSRIPVVEEVITDPNLQDTMLFDPYDVNDIVEKIHWGINNINELINLQKPLYEKLAARSWEVVAQEYVDYFNEIINEAKKGPRCRN